MDTAYYNLQRFNPLSMQLKWRETLFSLLCRMQTGDEVILRRPVPIAGRKILHKPANSGITGVITAGRFPARSL